jgi:predicted Zn-dependent protease
MGEVQKGREQDILFIAGMQKLIQNTPDNPHLDNVLARFCIERNLELSLAEESIRAALEVEPENPGFLLTSGRMHYALSQYKDAIQALERVVDMGKADYEAYYFLGLSFLGLDDAAGARRFLEIANQKNPERGEAQDALRALGELRSPPQGERKKP